MKKNFWVLIFIIITAFSMKAEACEITSYDKLYLISPKNLRTTSVIKSSTCSKEVDRKFLSAVKNASGVLPQAVLQRILGDENIALSPSKIRIYNLKNELNKKFDLQKGWSFGHLKLLNKKAALGLNDQDTLQMDCQQCHSTGEKNISLSLYNALASSSKTYWLQAKLLVGTKVLTPKAALSPAISQLSPAMFKEELIYVERPEKYFTNKSHLVFYRVNKPINQGQGLKFSDLSPINLVTSGVPTKVIFQSRGIRLRASGIPYQGGKLGELIKLRNPKTNKTIIGKVVDFNKVMVDL